MTLLEGLEVTVISLLKLRNENWTFRIDSEFLKKEYLKNIDKIKNLKPGYLKLNEAIIHMTGGATPLGAEYSESGIPFLRVQNIMQNYFSLNDVVYISEKQSTEIKRSVLKFKDVLLTITGVSYGKSATVTKKIEGSNINQHSVKITLNNSINPYFLSTFLNCSFGKLQSDKNIVGVTRPALDYEVIKNFNIPIVSENFQNQIESIILNSDLVNQHAETKYSQAETLLLETLGLNNFEPTSEAVNVKSFKESFFISGRLDAEYYQPKYEEIINAIKLNNEGYDKLETFIENYSTGFPYKSESYSDNGIPLIRINNIQNGELDLSNAANVPFEDVSLSPKDIANENDILISMSGTIGNSCKIPKGVKALVNQRIMRITPINYNVEILPLVINSIIGKMQLERIGTGGVQTNISATDIKEILLPAFDKQTQEKIASLVSESFTLKKQSEQLLETAKRAVEIAIEEAEEVAMRYIDDTIKSN